MHTLINQDRLPSSFLQQLATFPWYDSSVLNSSTPAMKTGSYWCDDTTGNWFMYVQAGGSLTNGQVVYQQAPAAVAVVNAASTVATTVLNSAGWTANAEVGNWIYFDNGGVTPGPTLRLIKANAVSTVTVSQRDMNSTLNQNDQDALSAVLTNGTNSSTYRPNIVLACTNAKTPIGVALATVTSTYYTVIQICGLALVSAIGNGTATVVDEPAKLSATAGSIMGAGAAACVYAGTSIRPQYAFSGAGPQLIPCHVNFKGVI